MTILGMALIFLDRDRGVPAASCQPALSNPGRLILSQTLSIDRRNRWQAAPGWMQAAVGWN